ncbi:Hypothetical predicted protein, partial [Olea europaea subsp. europaea]
DAKEKSNVIASTLLIANTPAYVLFDSGDTHSFASTTFMAKSSITCDKSEGTLEVSILSGNPLNTDRIAKSKQGEEPFSFLGMKKKPLIRLVSILQAEKMLRKETCQGYLVSISGGKQETTRVEDVPVEMAPPTHTNLMRDLLRAVQELSRQNQAPPQQNASHFASAAVSMVEQFRILLLSDVPAYVFFDSGATNSFISTSFVAWSNLACVKTNYELE